MTAKDVGRPSQARAQGGGASASIPRLALFDRFRYTAEVLSSGVKTEKPFYCYDAECVILKGTCDFEPVAAALRKENLHPVADPAGRAIASVWINNLRDSVIGPYHEIVVAFDASRQPSAARFDADDPFGLLYNYFGQPSICFLHTLYISSPLSILWGREMQAFPKHPKPAEIDISFSTEKLEFGARWGAKKLLSGSVTPDWGALPFLRQALALTRNFGPLPVLGFLGSKVALLPIVMPRAVKSRYGVAHDHTGHILKGLDPLGVRAWPCRAGDRLELGTGLEADAGEGQESPTDLLVRAHFQPRVVIHLPSLQLVVTDNEMEAPK